MLVALGVVRSSVRAKDGVGGAGRTLASFVPSMSKTMAGANLHALSNSAVLS